MNLPGNSADPDTGSGHNGWRSFGDGLIGRIVASRLQGFSAVDADYRDVAVDSAGVLQVSGGGSGGGGGPVTVADGADVAQGATTDASTASTVVGVLKAIKGAVTGTLTVGTHAVTDGGGSLTVDGSIAVSNLPATQPVSAAALPLPAGASTETTVAAVSTATGTVADAESGSGNGTIIALLKRARTILGDISSDLGVPTDAETTSNGSLIAILKRVRTLLNGGLPAALGASGGLKVEQVVAGPTQPVSAAALPLPAGAAQDRVTATAPSSVELSTGTAFYDARDRNWTVTEIVKVGDAVNNAGVHPGSADAKADATVGLVTNARLHLENGAGWDRARGDVANGLDVDVTRLPATQDKKDGTRVLFVGSYSSAAPPTADTLVNVTPARDGAAAAAAASIAVTAGKRLRIEAIVLSCRATAASLPWAKAVLRMNPTGAAVLASPLVFHIVAAGNAAAIGNAASAFADLPDGVEFSGAMQIGLSISGNVATNQVDVTIIGFEYTP